MPQPELFYIEDNCYCWTFEAEKVKQAVEINCSTTGKTLNLFAGKCRLKVNEIRVDESEEFRPDYHMKAEEFIPLALEKQWHFATIIYDPPWNERKAKEFYEGRYIGKFTKLKTDIVKLLENGGNIISIGYEITNFGKIRNMEVKRIYVVDPKGEIRPYFISIERQINARLF